MKFYVLASFIIFLLVVSHNIRKSDRQQALREKTFWEKERMANEVRRKSLDQLAYIKIPLKDLPMTLEEQDAQIAECLRIIRELSLQPIVNLTGFSNTDLKLEYGTANISVLSEYDQNYTLLANTLQQWADLLYSRNYIKETRQILEFAVSTRTDVSRTYDMLADIYTACNESRRIDDLTETAQMLNSLNREVILRHLQKKADHS